jgi:hypothetical protein
MPEKYDRPALRNLLHKLVQYGPAEKSKRSPLPLEMADPELVKKAIARAKRLLISSPEELKNVPSPSQCIH